MGTKSKGKRSNFYAVAAGRIPGIYDEWSQANQQVLNFKNNNYKGFSSLRKAKSFMEAAGVTMYKHSYSEVNVTATDNPSNSNSTEDLSWSSSFHSNTTSTPKPPPPDINHTPTPTTSSQSNPIFNTHCTGCTTLAAQLQSLATKVEQLEEIIQSQAQLKSTYNDNVSHLTSEIKTLHSKLSNFDILLQKELSSKVLPNLADHSKSSTMKPQPTFADAIISTPISTSPTAPSISASSPSPRQQTAPKTSPKINKSKNNFQPDRCIVITSHDHMIIRKLNTDQIRRTISANHGPTLIDNISRYKFNSPNPKYMVQLSSKETAEKIVSSWHADAFGGTSARLTIKPTEDPNIGMMRGVPLDIPSSDIDESLKSIFKDITHTRLSKNDQPLRTIKLNFNDQTQLKNAIEHGILLKSCNMLFRVEPPFSNSNHG